MDDFLHLLQLVFNSEQLVGLKGVLPLSQIDLEWGKLDGLICCHLLIQDASWLELVSKLHDQLVQKSVRCAFIILVVCDGCRCNSVKCIPAMALANVLFE